MVVHGDRGYWFEPFQREQPAKHNAAKLVRQRRAFAIKEVSVTMPWVGTVAELRDIFRGRCRSDAASPLKGAWVLLSSGANVATHWVRPGDPLWDGDDSGCTQPSAVPAAKVSHWLMS